MKRPAFLLSLLFLGGCEQLGIETPAQTAARQESEGKAVGGACRHAGRAIEDCYTLNRKISKAAIYTGWREMDIYMRENNLQTVTPVVPLPEKKKPSEASEEKSGDDEAKGAKEENKSAKPAKSGH